MKNISPTYSLEENLSDQEEEARIAEEERLSKLKELVDNLRTMENQTSALLTEKNKLVFDMRVSLI